MTRIYISLPISGQEEDARKKVERMKDTLREKGYLPVSPFEITKGKNPQYEDHICTDLREMLDCDAILFCKGWEQSCGCLIEHHTAMQFMAHNKKDFNIIYEES